mgnify:CR=1 FL=1
MKGRALFLMTIFSLILPNIRESLYGSLEKNAWYIYFYISGLFPQNIFEWLLFSAFIFIFSRILAGYLSGELPGRAYWITIPLFGVVYALADWLFCQTTVTWLMYGTNPIYMLTPSRSFFLSAFIVGMIISSIGIWLSKPICKPGSKIPGWPEFKKEGRGGFE